MNIITPINRTSRSDEGLPARVSRRGGRVLAFPSRSGRRAGGGEETRAVSVTDTPVEIPGISPQRLHELPRGGRPVEVIDVRPPAESRHLHAAIARLVPLDELDPAAVMAG